MVVAAGLHPIDPSCAKSRHIAHRPWSNVGSMALLNLAGNRVPPPDLCPMAELGHTA